MRGAGVALVAGTVDGVVTAELGADVVGAVEPDGSDVAGWRGPGWMLWCDSECDASRIATLSNATVNVTRRLNRISSTRNALVCTL